jgi:hypothetical protein
MRPFVTTTPTRARPVAELAGAEGGRDLRLEGQGHRVQPIMRRDRSACHRTSLIEPTKAGLAAAS